MLEIKDYTLAGEDFVRVIWFIKFLGNNRFEA